jgi:hypothetical protein
MCRGSCASGLTRKQCWATWWPTGSCPSGVAAFLVEQIAFLLSLSLFRLLQHTHRATAVAAG